MDEATTPENMELAAQVVNLCASLLLMLPMYLLGRQFFDRTISLGATLLYQYLPVSAQHLSDGISEPTYLVLLVSGLLMMARAIENRSAWSSAACGVFAGLAYLFRPEGLLIVPAFGLALSVVQMRSEWRSSRGRFVQCGLAMVLAAMLVGSIYVYATGRITNKLSAIEIFNNLLDKFRGGQACNSMQLFAVSFVPNDSKGIRLAQSASAFSKELLQGLHYAGIGPAILGFWWSFADLRCRAGFWALGIYAALHSAILIALAMSVYYVSDRHVMILVLLASFFVVVGLRELPRRVLAWMNGLPSPGQSWVRSAPVWFAVLFVALIGASLPRATQRLHGLRVGNHEAGKWLAAHVDPDADVIEDDHAWSWFFSGLFMNEGKEKPLRNERRATLYVVTTRSRDPQIDANRGAVHFIKDAEIVYTWPEQISPDKARIIVHARTRDFKTHPWRKSQ
jgi:hypothetical protein